MNRRDLPVPVRHVVVPAGQVSEREGVVTFLSGTTRKGRWTLARHTRHAIVLGNVTLDLREAEIADGVSEIEVMAVFGNCEVIVPPGVRVECGGAGFFGNFEVKMTGAPDFPPGAPIVRIRGSAYFSNVEAMVKAVGRRELRAERKLLGE